MSASMELPDTWSILCDFEAEPCEEDATKRKKTKSDNVRVNGYKNSSKVEGSVDLPLYRFSDNLIPERMSSAEASLVQETAVKSREYGRQWNCKSMRGSRKKINLLYLIKSVCFTKESCIEWLKSMGFMAKQMFCPNCGKKMKYESQENSQDGYMWFCGEKECERSKIGLSVRYGTWFEYGEMSLVELLLFTYFWTHSFSQVQIIGELNLSTDTYRAWDLLFSNICEEIYKRTFGEDTEDDSDSSKDGMNSKLSAVVKWKKKNKTRDPFIEFLKDADSLKL